MNTLDRYQLTEVINVSGTMTAIGASSAKQEVIDAMADILPRFVSIDELQERASTVISRVVGSEAGCVTASAASGVVISIAACMVGEDLYRAERLPENDGDKTEVVMQRGHATWYGASVGQLVRMAGARLLEVGDATRAGAYQLAGAITDRTAAALYVTSHHTVQYGLIDLREFCRVAHEKGVPVVVDAASESEMRWFIEAGADLVCFSGHKFLAGPTSGIVAGRRDLVRACVVHQHAGIGRPMKAGKESIIGVMAALDRWESLDHAQVQQREQEVVRTFMDGLQGIEGIQVVVEPDPTGNPIDRVRVTVRPAEASLTAFHLAHALRRNAPPIIVRDHHAIDEGFILLDPCNATPDQASYVVQRIRSVLQLPDAEKALIRQAGPAIPNGADLQEQSFRRWSQESNGHRE